MMGAFDIVDHDTFDDFEEFELLESGITEFSVEEYLILVQSNVLVDSLGEGYPVVDGREILSIRIVPSEGARCIPRSATHIRWYEHME